jgi:hypothetical protein
MLQSESKPISVSDIRMKSNKLVEDAISTPHWLLSKILLQKYKLVIEGALEVQ